MLSLAKSIIKTLKETYSLDSVIAGGYPRDVYYNIEPKDIDIVVACKLEHRDIFNIARSVCATLTETKG